MFSPNNCIDMDNADNHRPSAFHKSIHSSQAMIMQRNTSPIQVLNTIRPIPTNSGFYSPPTNMYAPNLSMPTAYNNYPSIWYENTLGNGLTYATNDSLLFAQAYHRQRQYEHRGPPYSPIYCTSTMLASADDEIQAYSNFGYLREIYTRNGFTNCSNVANSRNNRVFKQARPSCSETFAPINSRSVLGNGNIDTTNSFVSAFSPKQVSGGYFSHDSNSMRITSVNAPYSPVSSTTPVNVPMSLHNEQDNGQNNQSGNEAKENTTITITEKKKRGRKPKAKCENAISEMVVSIPGGTALFTVPLASIKRKRGRPRKPNPALFFPAYTKPAPVAAERYKRGKSPNSIPSVIDDQVSGPSSIHVAGDSDVQVVGYFPKSTLRKQAAEADKSRDEYTSVVNSGVMFTAHAKRCRTQGQTRVIVPTNKPLVETNGRSITEEEIGNYHKEDTTDNEPANECEPSRDAPPETRDHNILTNDQEKTPTTSQYANKDDNNQIKGRLNLKPSKIEKKNQLKRMKKTEKKRSPSSKGTLIENANGKRLEFIDDQAIANKSELILKDTSGTTSNVGKRCLDMPNIFDMLETPAPPTNQTDKDDQQSESLSDLEEMINVHIYGVDENISERLDANKITKRGKTQRTATKEPTKVDCSYTRSFLSDVSDDESNYVERNANTNSDPIRESSFNHNPELPSSSNDTRSSLPQNVITKTLPICEPMNYFPHLHDSMDMDIDVENSTTESVTPLSGFNTQSGDLNEQNVNLFDIRQNYLHETNEKDHMNFSQDFDSTTAVEKNVERIFGTFYPNGGDIVETAIPQTSNLTTNLFLQYRDPMVNKQENMNTSFISLWQDLTKFNDHEAKFYVCRKFASSSTQSPLVIANHKRKCTIKFDECASAFVKVCKLPSTEKSCEEREGNKSSKKFECIEGEIHDDGEKYDRTDFGPCVHRNNSFLADPPVVHKYDSFDRLPYSQSDLASFTTHGRDRYQENLSAILPADNRHSKFSPVSSSAQIEFLRGEGQGLSNSLHTTATSSGSYSKRKNHQNNDVSNSVVTRKNENTFDFSNGNKRQVAVNPMKTTPSQGVSPSVNTLAKCDRKMPKKSVRTHPMIKKLMKFTKSQTCTNCVNETKSKLNADLCKVFILGSNKSQLPPLSTQKSKLKEVKLEIPGPMERRPRNRGPTKKKIAQNNDQAEGKIARYRELAKKKIADQLTTKNNGKGNMIRNGLSKKTQKRTPTRIRKLSICPKPSKSEHQNVGVEQNTPRSFVQRAKGEITNTARVQTQQNEDTDLDEEVVNNTEGQTQQNGDTDLDEEIVNNMKVQTQQNGDIDLDEDDDDILEIYAERDTLLDL